MSMYWKVLCCLPFFLFFSCLLDFRRDRILDDSVEGKVAIERSFQADAGERESLEQEVFVKEAPPARDADPDTGLIRMGRIGGKGAHLVSSVASDREGNFYLYGSYENEIKVGDTTLRSEGGTDIFLVKMSREGQVLWVKGFGSEKHDGAGQVKISSQGAIYLTGTKGHGFKIGNKKLSLSSNQRDKDCFFAKLDISGNVLWAKSIGASSGLGSMLSVSDAKGFVYLLAIFHQDLQIEHKRALVSPSSIETKTALIKMKANGDVLWSKNLDKGYNSSLNGYSLVLSKNGDMYIGGSFRGTPELRLSNGDKAKVDPIPTRYTTNAFVMKTNQHGEITWFRSFGGAGSSVVLGISHDKKNHPIITGTFDGNVSFGRNSFVSKGAEDIFVAKISNEGNLLWARSFGSTGQDFVQSIEQDLSGNIYFAGYIAESERGGHGWPILKMKQAFVSKLDADGSARKSVTYNASEMIQLYDMKVNDSGEFLIVGTFSKELQVGNSKLTTVGFDAFWLIGKL